MNKYTEKLPYILWTLAVVVSFALGSDLPISLSIVIVALSGAAMFQTYLVRQDQPNIKKELEALQISLETQRLADRKELDKEIERMKDEVSKVAVTAGTYAAPSNNATRPKDKFEVIF